MATESSPAMKSYKGSCHCGAFEYTVKHAPLDDTRVEVMNCNCSVCDRNGYLFIYPLNENVEFQKGSMDEFKSYFFGSKKMGHYFCGTCGSSCMAKSIDPNFYFDKTAVNTRMLHDVDVKAFKTKQWDGKNWNPPKKEDTAAAS